MPKISVIMPVYNVEKYLRECLDSVLAQTMRDFEVICVDDESTDGSVGILEEYAKRDSRVRVFRRPHSNAGAVRNFGMSVARGEFYIFLDSDDYFSPWMFETLLNGILQENADIAACDSIWFKDGIEHPSFSAPENVVWSDATAGAVDRGFIIVAPMPWNKMFRRSFIEKNDIHWQEIRSTNDLYFSMMAMSISRRTVHSSNRLIAYRQHQKSLQALKGKNPEDFFLAVSKYYAKMDEGSLWDVKDNLKDQFFEFLLSSFFYEFDTQPSMRGYLRFGRAVTSFARRCGLDAWSRYNHSSAATRYKKIVRHGLLAWSALVANAFIRGTLNQGRRAQGWRLRAANLGIRVLQRLKMDI